MLRNQLSIQSSRFQQSGPSLFLQPHLFPTTFLHLQRIGLTLGSLSPSLNLYCSPEYPLSHVINPVIQETSPSSPNFIDLPHSELDPYFKALTVNLPGKRILCVPVPCPMFLQWRSVWLRTPFLNNLTLLYALPSVYIMRGLCHSPVLTREGTLEINWYHLFIL